jgi:hypothetical protein
MFLNPKKKQERADRKIQQEIERLFSEEKYLSQHPVEVTVIEGVAILEGTVTTPLLQNLAEEIAIGVEGIREVQNNLSLGVGRVGEEVLRQHMASNDPEVSDASNTGDPDLHHPSTTGFTEVRSQTREDITGGLDSGITADESAQIAIPSTGQGSSVMDAGAVDAMKESGTQAKEDILEHVLTRGLPVVDREGKRVGKVKEVRNTDFLLSRTLARDVYVPYYVCEYDGTQVTINVLADEISSQGWAMPRLF